MLNSFNLVQEFKNINNIQGVIKKKTLTPIFEAITYMT